MSKENKTKGKEGNLGFSLEEILCASMNCVARLHFNGLVTVVTSSDGVSAQNVILIMLTHRAHVLEWPEVNEYLPF